MTHRYVNPDGVDITREEWAVVARDLGVGVLLAESVVPGPDCDLTVRTVWLGLECPAIGVRAFGTAYSRTGTQGPWVQVEQYDTRAAAERGHTACAARLSTKDA